MLPILESKFGLKLFYANRDMLGGGNEHESRLEAMSRCARIIIVASDSYMDNEWCAFERAHALLRHNKKRSREAETVVRNELVVVQLEMLNRMSEEVARALDTHPHVEWTSDVTGQRLFWEQLVDLLRGKDVGFALNCRSWNGCRRRGGGDVTRDVDDVPANESRPLLSQN